MGFRIGEGKLLEGKGREGVANEGHLVHVRVSQEIRVVWIKSSLPGLEAPLQMLISFTKGEIHTLVLRQLEGGGKDLCFF